MGDRLEAWDRPGTSGTAGDEVPGPRAYARRWVFLLVVSLLSCSNAMVLGCWNRRGGRGGVFPAAPAPVSVCFFTGNHLRLAQEVVKEGASACSAWEGPVGVTGLLVSRVSALWPAPPHTLPSPPMLMSGSRPSLFIPSGTCGLQVIHPP